jgi:hypothetical protein
VTVKGDLTVAGSVVSSGTDTFENLAYTGTLTGGTGVVNIGAGQVYKDASGNLGLGFTSPTARLHNIGSTILGSATFGSGTTTKINISSGGIGYVDLQNSAATSSAIGRGNGIRFFSSSSVASMARIEAVTDDAGDLSSGTLRIISGNQIAISANGVGVVSADGAGNTTMNQNVSITGSLSKGSGSFKIDHPLKPDTHHLVHSFIEGPKADNLYRGKATLIAGSAAVDLDEVGGMTPGTFEALNRDGQCFTSNEAGWTQVRGRVVGSVLTIEAQDATCTDEVSWLVIGERQDAHIMAANWTDNQGRVIVEPEKVDEPIDGAVEPDASFTEEEIAMMQKEMQ